MVTADNTYERDSVNVMPLCNHLRPHQQINLTPMQPRQQPLHVRSPTYSVAIHPPNPSPRKYFLQPLLALLRPSP